MSEDVKNQLHVLHDPFSRATAQPKIPDGKVNNSLGFTTRAVTEFVNDIDAVGPDTGATVIHMLFYAGQSTGLVVRGINPETVAGGSGAVEGRDYYVLGYEDAGGCNILENVVAAEGEPPEGFIANVLALEKYAMHRIVSSGLQLKLLNTQEEDDGWFECVRINEQMTESEFQLSTRNNSSEVATEGCVTPSLLLEDLVDREITNDPTYATGLLRDLHRVQFELHGRLDFHDFRQMKSSLQLTEKDQTGIPSINTTRDVGLLAGSVRARDVINQYIDPHFDMIYVRLHCRQNNEQTSTENGSRIHTNLISNQEIYFETGDRENRYHTNSYSIGQNATSMHLQARRSNRNAITPLGT